VNYASRIGLRVAVQGTGHGGAALGPLDDTVLIKTHELEEVTVDSANRRARVGAGVNFEDVVKTATALGLWLFEPPEACTSAPCAPSRGRTAREGYRHRLKEQKAGDSDPRTSPAFRETRPATIAPFWPMMRTGAPAGEPRDGVAGGRAHADARPPLPSSSAEPAEP
jgi:hypothetical protein